MVEFLVLCTGCAELNRCFVGKTKTFWQSTEQRLLEALRKKRILDSSVLIQCILRGRYCRRLLSNIISAESKSLVGFEKRDPALLKTIADEIRGNIVQLKTSFGAEYVSDPLPAIDKFMLAINAESKLTANLTACLSFSPLELINSFESIERCVSEVLANNTSVSVRGRIFVVDYRDNSTITKCLEKAALVRRSATLKREFDSGIRDKNELLLEKALLRLDEEKKKGKKQRNFVI